MAKKKRTEMAPVLQTIKDYLANHYMDELLQELTAGMRLGEGTGASLAISILRSALDTYRKLTGE
jgi:hypothetical protein